MALYHSAKGSVNYTVVASPTIVDGVVSGFSGENYLETASTFDASSALSQGCSLQVKFTLPSEEGSGGHLLYAGFSAALKDGISVADSGRLEWYIFGSNNILRNYNKLLTYGQTYVACGVIANGVATLYCGPDEEHLEVYATKTIETGTFQTARAVRIGVARAGGSPFAGTIDLTKTFVSIGGQPWFGVCPVEVKHINYNSNRVNYLIRDGKLIWADSGLYMEANGVKTYATQNLAPVPSGFTYGDTTTTDGGIVDIPTQVFTAHPGATVGRDE